MLKSFGYCRWLVVWCISISLLSGCGQSDDPAGHGADTAEAPAADSNSSGTDASVSNSSNSIADDGTFQWQPKPEPTPRSYNIREIQAASLLPVSVPMDTSRPEDRRRYMHPGYNPESETEPEHNLSVMFPSNARKVNSESRYAGEYFVLAQYNDGESTFQVSCFECTDPPELNEEELPRFMNRMKLEHRGSEEPAKPMEVIRIGNKLGVLFRGFYSRGGRKTSRIRIATVIDHHQIYIDCVGQTQMTDEMEDRLLAVFGSLKVVN